MKKTSKRECASCPALCCEGLTIDISRPKTKDDVEVLKWKLQYEPVGVYILNKRWHLFVEGKCGYLGENDLCTKYEERSEICRRHNPPDCERFVDWYDVFFETPEDLEEYLLKEHRRLKRRNKARNNKK